MKVGELRSTLVLAFIFATRMLGLFMVLPILVLYVDKISGATLGLLGLAVGIYGFTQAVCQLPYGMLSDYVGRKPMIWIGLAIFAVGSLVAACSTSIWGVIIGRAIQGAGAIGSPVLALIGDTTREEVRTRAMALIGISIGLTFVIAIVLGPWLDAHIGLFGIFAFTAGLAITGMALLLGVDTQKTLQKPVSFGSQLKTLSLHKDLHLLNINIFVLHTLFTASFLVLPLKIQEIVNLFPADVWKFYLPVLALSLVFVMPLLRHADSKMWQKRLMKMAMIGLGVSIPVFMLTTHISILIVAVTLFFIAFNFLEASLPALVSKVAPKTSKGSAMGLYSCAQFLGIFSGGALGGVLLQNTGTQGIGFSCVLLAIIGWVTIQRLQYFLKIRS